MSNQTILSARQQRDQAKLVYQTWDIATSILETLEEFSAPISQPVMNPGELFPVIDGDLMAIPGESSTITLTHTRYVDEHGYPLPLSQAVATYTQVSIILTPNPLAIAQQMQVKFLPQPTVINMTLRAIKDYEGDIIETEILREMTRLHVYDPKTEEKIEETGVNIPESILEIMNDIISPHIDRNQFKNDYFNFTWPVYWVIPPSK